MPALLAVTQGKTREAFQKMLADGQGAMGGLSNATEDAFQKMAATTEQNMLRAQGAYDAAPTRIGAGFTGLL